MTAHLGMAGKSPSLSIGMPVFNAEKYLEASLDSLLSQTFSDFELIVSDNASTDGTRDICARYQSWDDRVRYTRHERNIGGPRNWNFVVQGARGTFFKWASSNDLYRSTFLQKCIDILAHDSSVVLCYTNTLFIDENGSEIGEYEDPVDLMSSNALARFSDYLVKYRRKLNNAQAGVIRADVLLKTGLEGNYPHGEIALMAELALHGKYYRIPEQLFFRRMSPDSATPKRGELALSQFVHPDATKPLAWVWPQCFDLIAASLRAPGAVPDKWRAFAFVLRTMKWRRDELWTEMRGICGRRVLWRR